MVVFGGVYIIIYLKENIQKHHLFPTHETTNRISRCQDASFASNPLKETCYCKVEFHGFPVTAGNIHPKSEIPNQWTQKRDQGHTSPESMRKKKHKTNIPRVGISYTR